MKKLFEKLCNRETITYLFFGVLTTLINWIVFDRLNYALGSKYAEFNDAVAFVVSVLFAFFTNKPFVFQSNDWSARTLAKEIPLFFGGRIVSFLIEEGLIVAARDVFHADLYSILGINGLSVSKVPISVIVVVLNYIFSKYFAFRKTKNNPEEEKNGKPRQ